jgi:hypothetical protein
MRLFTAAALFMLAACSAAEQPRPPARDEPLIPFEDVGACPFEGCVYREWVANSQVAVLAMREPGAAAAFTLRVGDTVTALGGVVITTAPGRVAFDAPADLETSAGVLHVEPGQTLYLLTSRGEGFMKAWFEGQLYDSVDTTTFSSGAPCGGGPRRCSGRIVSPWRFEWWIYLRNDAGQTGWTNEPAKFDNKDALG